MLKLKAEVEKNGMSMQSSIKDVIVIKLIYTLINDHLIATADVYYCSGLAGNFHKILGKKCARSPCYRLTVVHSVANF